MKSSRHAKKKTVSISNDAVPGCLVAGYQDLIPALALPDENDRHVLAAAIRTYADVIVTFNEKDFPGEYLSQFEIEAQHPDDFVMRLIDLSEAQVWTAAKTHRSMLKKPPKTVEESILSIEQQGLPKTAGRLRDVSDLI